jgi:phosphoglycerate dehydrogenase-like enzyme
VTRIAVLPVSRRGAAVVHGGFSVLPRIATLFPEDDVVTIYVDEDMAAAAGAEVGIGGLDGNRLRALLRVAPDLRWYHAMSAGVDDLMIPEVLGRRELDITNGSGAYDQPVAEYVLATILAAAKQLPTSYRAQLRHEWQSYRDIADVRGATLVVVGMGSIGSALANLARSIGMRVVGVRRTAGKGSVPIEQLADVVAEADYIAVCVAFTPETRNLIDAKIVERMRPSAWIINVSRGAVIEESALLAACREGRIGGAALDVWWTEPLPPESPWWDLPNVIVTPHRAALSPTLHQRSLELLAENLRRFRLGEPLMNLVDKQQGY